MGGEATDSMQGRIRSGLAWKVISQVFRQLSRVAVVVVLARLLTPAEYGLAAMVLVFSSLVLIFADLALGAALVQRRELSQADRSTVFWTSVAAGAVFMLLGIAASWPIAALYGEDGVQPLFAALSVSFLITALGTTHSALLNRDMRFRSLELRMMAGTVAGGTAGILVAAQGGGAWAIIAQQLAIAVTSTALLWAFSPWRPRLTYSLASFRSLAGFSGNVFGTRILFYANRNLDNLLIGRFLGAAALGAYAVAYNVMLMPLARIAQPIVEVLFPAMSRIQDDRPRMAAMWLRANRMIGAISIPAMVGLMIVAPEFVMTLFGERWESATPVIQILAWVGLLQSLQRLNSSVLQACDRTGTLLRYSIVVLIASVVAFAAGLNWGIVGVAVGYAISSTLVEPYYTWLTARVLSVSPGALVASLAGVAQATVGMAAVVIAAKLWIVSPDLPAGIRLAIFVTLGAATYLALAAWRAPELRADLRGLRRRQTSPAPQPA
jgi:O-antigen/teichoic acid export membrane protein